MSIPKVFHARCVGATMVVSPIGSVSSLAGGIVHPELERLLEHIRTHQIRNVVFDLEQVEYFGSVMLAAMHAVWRRVRSGDGKMVLCRVSTVGREVLAVAHFDTIWPIYPTPVDAVTAVSSSSAQVSNDPSSALPDAPKAL
jgi:anti-anti-sigma factor